MKGIDRMKWFLVKAGCIIGAGIIAAVLWGDILAGVLIAPFGWIVGKAAQVWSDARGVALVAARGENSFAHEEEDIEDITDISHTDTLTDPSYASLAGNVWHNTFVDFYHDTFGNTFGK